MGKKYCKPATLVTEVMMDSLILAGSGAGPAPAPGVKASRNGYGEGGTETW